MKKYELQFLISLLVAITLLLCEDTGIIAPWLEWALLGVVAVFLILSFMNFNYGDESDE